MASKEKTRRRRAGQRQSISNVSNVFCHSNVNGSTETFVSLGWASNAQLRGTRALMDRRLAGEARHG